MPGPDTISAIANAALAPQPLANFLTSVTPLTVAERRLIVDQALLLMEEVYVHLPLKRAMHAVDPVQRLRVLKHRIELVDERAFHEEMISTFMGVRDLHTNYMLPDPYNRSLAFIPFELLEFYNGDKRVFIVGGVAQGLVHATFKTGMVVTHWNGTPIERAVELNARRNAGSNAAASHARGLEAMTFRSLMMSLPPDEEWVDIRYLTPDGAAHEIRFKWLVSTSMPSPRTGSIAGASDPSLRWKLAQGIDPQALAIATTRKHLFDQRRVDLEQEVVDYLRGVESEGDGPDFNAVSRMPEYFQFAVKQTTKGPRGYIRIATFATDDPDAFVAEFVRIVRLMPPSGLIVDVRGNGGGTITAGEKILQALTSTTIEPERLHFITTPAMVRLVEGFPQWFAAWGPSMKHALLIGAAFSQGLPIEDQAAYNQIGRVYNGKVVLLIDARCYSTTDIFAAGFQDHEIGPVLGTDACTGAGGANVFDWSLLVQVFDQFSTNHPFKALPKGADLRVAIRRTTRVRAQSGVPLEDLGVTPDTIHKLTISDLVEDDRELIEKAAGLTA